MANDIKILTDTIVIKTNKNSFEVNNAPGVILDIFLDT